MLSPDFEILDPRMRSCLLGNVFVERLYSGMRWAEGPVWFGDSNTLIWSDIPNNRLMRWHTSGHVEVFRQPSNNANGNTRDRQGRLVTCEHGLRRVTRTELDGTITVLASAFEGKRLNSPNDVVVHSDGSVWFTDPDYGIMTDYEGHRSHSEIGACHVYRIDAHSGQLTQVTTGFGYDKPNGLAFSPDETQLYIADTGQPQHVRVHQVLPGGRLDAGRVFAENTGTDGFRFDENGNFWTSSGDGVRVYGADGVLLGKIRVPEVVSNIAFGGPAKNRLFITATTSLYAVYVAPRGAMVP